MNQNRIYWACQVMGWGGLAIINIFFSYTNGQPVTHKIVVQALILFALGISISHILRNIILKENWLNLPFEKLIPLLLLGILIGSFFYALGLSTIFELFWLSQVDVSERVPFFNNLITRTLSCCIILFFWVLIYYFYHFIQRTKQQEIDTFKLQSLVKDMELKTIKAHINPHFIFNALNSIRALVDENPERARKSITELSSILRSSLKSEHEETVLLRNELDIVKDYLALEEMRFEERLRVEFDIDEATLTQPIPPMMIQTLVENAIKHGIGKRVEGGLIKIRSMIANSEHLIIIQNSGSLQPGISDDGFGIRSTIDRLKIIFGQKAKFSISSVNDMVEVTIVLPLKK